MTQALAIVLFLLARLLRAAQKAYAVVPARELRRRSAKGDDDSHQMYLAARYEGSLQIFLEIFIIFSASALAYMAFENLQTTWAITASTALLYYFFIVSPQTASRSFGKKLAIVMAPTLAKILRLSSPILHLIQPASYKRSKFIPLYDSDDLVDFLKAQTKVEDSRISPVDLKRAIASLENRDVFVADAMIKQKNMKYLKEKDEIGPVLLSELHKSEQDCFAVGSPDDIKGVISLEDLIDIKHGGTVDETMDIRPVYVRADWLLSQAVDVFVQTKKTIFLVTNQKENIKGIISFQKILNEVFDQKAGVAEQNYYDKDAVAGS